MHLLAAWNRMHMANLTVGTRELQKKQYKITFKRQKIIMTMIFMIWLDFPTRLLLVIFKFEESKSMNEVRNT